MPVTIKCRSCGFVLYMSDEPTSIERVLQTYGYRCPSCLSPLRFDLMQPEYEIQVLSEEEQERARKEVEKFVHKIWRRLRMLWDRARPR